MRAFAAALSLALLLGPGARAGEAEGGDDGGPSGFARFGWRFLADEDEGRYRQDQHLSDGPRLFDLGLSWLATLEDGTVSGADFSARGLGDPASDAFLSWDRGDELELEGGWHADDYAYRATGDPYPFETDRERLFARARWTLSPDLRVRAGFDRDERKGYSRNEAFTRDTEGVPEGLAVPARRPLDRVFENFAGGVDWAPGPFRFGVSQSARLGWVDDTRILSLPDEATPVREAIRHEARSKAWTTLLKAGVEVLDGDLALTTFHSFTRQPLRSRISGIREGYSNVFVEGGDEGPFASDLTGQNRHERSLRSHRAELQWRFFEDTEVFLGAEWARSADRVSLDLAEERDYLRPDLPDATIERDEESTVTYEETRLSADLFHDLTDDVRVRVGEEYYAERSVAPDETRGGAGEASELRGRTFRHVLGADVTPARGLSLSALGRVSTASDPWAATSPERAEEASARIRYRTGGLGLSAVYRRKAWHQDGSHDSNLRSDSASLGADYAAQGFAASSSLTWQSFHTRAGTSYYDFDVSPTGPIEDSVVYDSRDLILAVDARWELRTDARIIVRGTGVRNRGDLPLVSADLTLRGELDVCRHATFGLSLRGWLYDEHGLRDDDYSATAVEIDLTVRF